MDTDFFVSSFIRSKCLINYLEQLRKDLDFSHIGPALELYSKYNMKVTGKMKLESSPKNESDKSIFFKSKSYINKKPSESLATKHKGVQSDNKHTIEDYEKRLEKNAKKRMELFVLLKVKNMHFQW